MSVLSEITVAADDPAIDEAARSVLEKNKVAVFIVAYNAEKHIESVLKRIPPWVAERLAEVYMIDDHSTDQTSSIARGIEWPAGYARLNVYRTPYNQGYGGNQRLGYLYALKQKYDIVVLLHGDGQYAPEALPHILAPYAEGFDAVFGSRFLSPKGAIRGGMPLYKWVGNRILTRIQNTILGARMSEMHSGYRSYRMSALAQVPFQCNSLGFDFDADIIVQLLAAGFRIKEVPIPTYYGDEICRVNGMQYAWNCIRTAVKFRLMQLEIFYDPKFDIRTGKAAQSIYTAKESVHTLHYFMRSLPLRPESKLLDVGGGQGEAASRAHAEKGVDVTCIDLTANPEAAIGGQKFKQYRVDLDRPWNDQFPGEVYDEIFALDVLEHLQSPERGMAEIFAHLKFGGKLYASTGNVAFWAIRLMLLLGQFNYGRRGILDLTHRRLFTLGSFRRLMKNSGFKVEEVRAFCPPISDLSRRQGVGIRMLEAVMALLARLFPRLFAFQVLLVCTRTDSPTDLMKKTFA